jgi:hypothetical protein
MDKKEKENLKKIILKTETEILHEIEELEVKTAPIKPDCSPDFVKSTTNHI